ncbi:rhodanese-like domain-containing protein [Fulvivirga sedimenti]|uniref:Rhodanese-like domain-containing protein n=1 Tax=Fulvivirga sedimenti TaxID=2879465 RepID=A0A9X1KUH1_9BACT|nr:rhodanese-like domain-containing protein [Fulvivirga sedimenti]MCA6073503.1 rhodanese-like domain-containing protein [Fulvivirga sedimenti]
MIGKNGFFLLLLLLVSCNTATVQEIQTISTTEMVKLMENEKDLVILDVRTPAETAQGIIPGAIQIDWQDPGFNDKIKSLDTDKPVIVYCASGMRSAQAARALHSAKFSKVYDYSDGYYGWIQARQ